MSTDPIIVHVEGSCCTLVLRGSTILSEPDAIIIDWDGLPESPLDELLELRDKVFKYLSTNDLTALDNLISDSTEDDQDDQDDEDDGTDEFGSDEDEREED